MPILTNQSENFNNSVHLLLSKAQMKNVTKRFRTVWKPMKWENRSSESICFSTFDEMKSLVIKMKRSFFCSFPFAHLLYARSFLFKISGQCRTIYTPKYLTIPALN